MRTTGIPLEYRIPQSIKKYIEIELNRNWQDKWKNETRVWEIFGYVSRVGKILFLRMAKFYSL